MTNALINLQKMQLWETLLMPWTTILKFRMILLNWRNEPKSIEQAHAVLPGVSNHRIQEVRKHEIRPSWQAKTQLVKLSNSCFPSPPSQPHGPRQMFRTVNSTWFNSTTYSFSTLSLQRAAMRGERWWISVAMTHGAHADKFRLWNITLVAGKK